MRAHGRGVMLALLALLALLAGIALLPSSASRAQVAGGPLGFQSPSGNIHCVIDTTDGGVHVAACELRDFAGATPARPKDCELDWVPAASVDSRGRVGVFSCQGDTLQDPGHRKLAYGESVRHGDITCSSATAGVTCRNAAGRGFTVARAAIRTF